MRKLLLVLLCAPFFAWGAGVFTDADVDLVLTLSDEPCTDERVLALIPPELHDKFRSAVTVQMGGTFAACWGEPPFAPDRLYIVDERGFGGAIDRAAVKPARSI